jgi:hypothetical protein
MRCRQAFGNPITELGLHAVWLKFVSSRRFDVRHQPLSVVLLCEDDGGISNGRMLTENRFNPLGLDSLASQINLLIAAAYVVQLPFVNPPRSPDR